MNCDAVQKLIPLYYYGELSPDEEDRVEAHVFECASCAHETERQRTLAAALDRRSVDPPPLLADNCRADLMLAIQGGAPLRRSPGREPLKGPWRLFLDAMADTMSNWHRWRQPVFAAAMLTLGFFTARVPLWRGISSGPLVTSSSFSPESFATVKSVVPDSSGRVQIAYDETQRRVISGRMDDKDIRRLLVASLREENPDVRVQAVDLLKARGVSNEPDVREALLNRLANDPNPGVRLKALEGLKPLAADPTVRKALAQVLLTPDDNPAVRMQAVDLLIAQRDDAVVGVLQNVVQREDNNYVRSQCAKALKELNASLGTF